MDEPEMTDEEARKAIKALAAHVDEMTDGEAHNELCRIWWALPRQPQAQIKEIAAALDDLTPTQLLRAISATIHS